jgi:hypothetical protein
MRNKHQGLVSPPIKLTAGRNVGIVIENTLKNSPMFLGILQMLFKTNMST